MNQAAKLVSSSLLGNSYKTVFLAGKAYTVYPPTIKIIARGISYWSELELNEDEKQSLSIIARIPTTSKNILKGLSIFITGDVKYWQFKSRKHYRKWIKGTPSALPKEMLDAVQTIVELIGAADFFACAVLCKNVSQMAGKQK